MAATVAIVTGAGGGIGLAVCARLAGDGARVFGFERNVTLEADFTAAIEAAGGTGAFVAIDVADPAAVSQAVADVVQTAGRLDILVNNAGIRDVGPTVELAVDDWQRVIDVNLSGPLYCSQAAARVMVGQGRGSIVNVASIAGLVAFAERPAYTVTKHGLIGLTRVMAAELSASGVRVNAVCPGLTRTPLTESYADEPYVRESLKVVVPAGRPGDADEVAAAVAFLAGDAAGYISGVALPVDGGCTASQTFDVTGASPTFVKPFSVVEAGL